MPLFLSHWCSEAKHPVALPASLNLPLPSSTSLYLFLHPSYYLLSFLPLSFASQFFNSFFVSFLPFLPFSFPPSSSLNLPLPPFIYLFLHTSSFSSSSLLGFSILSFFFNSSFSSFLFLYLHLPLPLPPSSLYIYSFPSLPLLCLTVLSFLRLSLPSPLLLPLPPPTPPSFLYTCSCPSLLPSSSFFLHSSSLYLFLTSLHLLLFHLLPRPCLVSVLSFSSLLRLHVFFLLSPLLSSSLSFFLSSSFIPSPCLTLLFLVLISSFSFIFFFITSSSFPLPPCPLLSSFLSFEQRLPPPLHLFPFLATFLSCPLLLLLTSHFFS